MADDDPVTRLLVGEALEREGFAVTVAEGGEAALVLFAECPFDLILLDVLMPGLDGFTTCARLRQMPAGPHVPIVMITGLDDESSIQHAYGAGATDFITKPINWLLLTQRVRYALRASRAIEEVMRSQQSLAHAQRLAKIGNWEWSLADSRFACSDELRRIFDDLKLVGPATPALLLDRVRHSDRAVVEAARQVLLTEGTPLSADVRHVSPGRLTGRGLRGSGGGQGGCRSDRQGRGDYPGHHRAGPGAAPDGASGLA